MSIVGMHQNSLRTDKSKIGVKGMSKTRAKDLAKNRIRVNACAPGFVETDMTSGLPDKVVEMIKSKSSLNKMAKPFDIPNDYTFWHQTKLDLLQEKYEY